MASVRELSNFLSSVFDPSIGDPKIKVRDINGKLLDLNCAFELTVHDGETVLILKDVVSEFAVSEVTPEQREELKMFQKMMEEGLDIFSGNKK